MPAPSFCLLILSVTIATDSPPQPAPETVTLHGKVLMLTDALKARGLDLAPDPEPIAKQVVLLGEDGTHHAAALGRDQPGAFPGRAAAESQCPDRGAPIRRCSLPAGRHDRSRERRPVANARVFLRCLHDQRPLSPDLPVLPGPDGTSDEARSR